MRYKKVLVYAAALLMAGTLTACGGGGDSSSGTLAEGSGVENPSSSQTGSSSEAGGSSETGSSSQGTTSGQAESQEAQTERHMMTVDETMDFFGRLSPADLGLEGESMEAYEVYQSEKAIPVDGLPCMKVTAYTETEEGIKEPAATFLVARDGTAVYRLEGEQAVKLEIEG